LALPWKQSQAVIVLLEKYNIDSLLYYAYGGMQQAEDFELYAEGKRMNRGQSLNLDKMDGQ